MLSHMSHDLIIIKIMVTVKDESIITDSPEDFKI